MFALMLKSTHEAKVKIFNDTLRKMDALYQRSIETEKSNSASLRAQIKKMTPDYELGKQRRAQQKKDNAKRKERRAAKRAGV